MARFEFDQILGVPSDSDEIRTILNEYGLKATAIQRKRGESTAYLESERFGIALSFCDAGTRPEPKFGAMAEGALVLDAVFLFREGQQGYRQYQGGLPMALGFDDSRDVVRRKLGQPSKLNAFFPIDRWDFESHQIAVNFSDDGRRIEYLTIQLPMD